MAMLSRARSRIMTLRILRHLQTARMCASAAPSNLSYSEVKRIAVDLGPTDRARLLTDLQELHAKEVMESYGGILAKFKWRSKFGRPSKVAHDLTSDPTGQFCEVPSDWLHKRLVAKAPPPSWKELRQVGIHNSIPFIGFGFLDNLIMILAGDYIDVTIGAAFGISTMAAAALGNTISDVAGIGSAWYVENVANKIGITAPLLTPSQLDMKSARFFANMGRALGVVIGCLLGMFPLLFLPSRVEEDEKSRAEKMAEARMDADVL